MKKQKGFTLIEILVVIAVLIITAAGGVMVWEKKVVFSQTVLTEESPVGVLRGIACTPSEWLCKTEDTVLPDILCCWWHCLPKEILPPHLCPTNADLGQKDGTGKTGTDRHYYYFDYDLEKVVEVPPVLPN